MQYRSSILHILLPMFLLVILMTVALINYPVIFDKAKSTVIIVFIALITYPVLWQLLKTDNFSRNGGLLIGGLFIINITVEDFINWQTKTGRLGSTLTMMIAIFISFAVISAIKTFRTRNILMGLKSSFASALLGTLIALCFGFLICYLFQDKIIDILRGDRGYSDYSNPKAFTFFNAFDNASSHVIIAPIVSLLMGALGGVTALIILRFKKSTH
jgi:hypothetical protein